MNVAMYRFVSYSEWLSNEQETYPNARANADNTEVVISCNDGSGTHTKEEALAHIESNWTDSEVIPVD